MRFELTHLASKTHTIATLLIILTLACSWLYVHWNEPATYYNLKYDPEFPYFMNSLSVFNGKPYWYMDHPGTPVELLGTLILTLTYPLTRGSSDNFVMYHISNPGLFFIHCTSTHRSDEHGSCISPGEIFNYIEVPDR